VATQSASASGPLAEIRLLLFDVMGTVVDLDGTAHRTAVEVLAPMLTPDQAHAAVQTWERELGVRMDAVVAGTAPWRPHAELRAEALRTALSPHVGSELSAEGWARLDDVVRQADPWPDSPAALARLRELRTCVALSNAGVGELASLSRHGGLGWHAVVSAESAQSFKPNAGVYQTAN
jgi:2-haloacid dehalogenase